MKFSSRKRLVYMLIALIALQSVAVVAVANEEHQPYQDGTEQLNLDSQQAATETEHSPFPGTEFDCHHCGHCHSPSQVDFLTKLTNLNGPQIDRGSSTYTFNYISKLFSPALRPPIA